MQGNEKEYLREKTGIRFNVMAKTMDSECGRPNKSAPPLLTVCDFGHVTLTL